MTYLTDEARFDNLLRLPEGTDLGKAVNAAMRAVEEHNPDLSGVLPKNYTAIDSTTIASLLRHINTHAAVMRTRTRIEATDGVEICGVDVARSSRPVTARMSDNSEKFWVRMNNRTRALPEIEIEDYCRDHW